MELMAAPDQKSREVRREALLCCWGQPRVELGRGCGSGLGRCEKQWKDETLEKRDCLEFYVEGSPMSTKD